MDTPSGREGTARQCPECGGAPLSLSPQGYLGKEEDDALTLFLSGEEGELPLFLDGMFLLPMSIYTLQVGLKNTWRSET